MKTRRRDHVGPTNRLSSKAPFNALSSHVDSLLQKGIAHHRAGQLAAAEALYLQVLRIMPTQPDAPHLLGLIAHQAGKYQLA